jgi:hypothetical protein
MIHLTLRQKGADLGSEKCEMLFCTHALVSGLILESRDSSLVGANIVKGEAARAANGRTNWDLATCTC